MKKNVLIIILSLIAISSVSTTLYFMFFYVPEPPVIPDYAPDIHDYVVTIPEAEDDKNKPNPSSQGNGAVVSCGSIATVHLNDKAVEYYYSNPSRSASSVVIQIIVDNQVIAQSGAIHPGYRTYTLALERGVKLHIGEYDAILKIAFYHPDTGKKATVDSEVEIHVRVVE